MKDCFTEIYPSVKDTYSFHSTPCTYEEEVFHPRENPLGVCPFRQICERIGSPHDDLGMSVLQSILINTYTNQIRVTLSEPSSSIVVRSEHQFHRKDHERHSLRKHYYEMVDGNATQSYAAYTEGSIDQLGGCGVPLDKGDLLGQYIGFIDLRLSFNDTPIAMGFLAVPKRLQADPDAFCITGCYGAFFGGPAFPCTVYSMQDRGTSGAMCAQAACITVLGFLSDRGATLRGSYDLTYLGGKRSPLSEHPHLEKAVNASATLPENVLAVGGLAPPQVAECLTACDTSAHHIEVFFGGKKAHAYDSHSQDAPRFGSLKKIAEGYADRLITAYVGARFPVILALRYDLWKPGEDIRGHAVTIVGYKRKSKHQARRDCYIVHDPAEAPFRERRVNECFHAAWGYGKFPDSAEEKAVQFHHMEMVAVAEKRIKRHMDDCFAWWQREEPEAYVTAVGFWPHTRDVYDYQFVLLHREDLHTMLTPIPLFGRRRRKLQQELVDSAKMESHFHWCIAMYYEGRLVVVWAFDAEKENTQGQPPQLRFLIDANDRLIAHRWGGSAFDVEPCMNFDLSDKTEE